MFSSFIGETHKMFCFFPVWIFPSGSSMRFATLDLHMEAYVEIFIRSSVMIYWFCSSHTSHFSSSLKFHICCLLNIGILAHPFKLFSFKLIENAHSDCQQNGMLLGPFWDLNIWDNQMVFQRAWWKTLFC